MNERQDVLWTCLVCEGDSAWLSNHLRAIRACNPRPRQLLVIDNDASSLILSQVQRENPGWFEYLPPDPPETQYLGYYASFNQAVSRALDDETFEWLAIMTVRASPMCDWLGNAYTAAGDKTGMVATLHLNSAERVYGLGHFLSPSAGCLDFGFGTHSVGLPTAPVEDIWAACAGGALYRTSFLRKARSLMTEILHPYGFLSNGCQGIGFLARHFDYRIAVAQNAVCYRDTQGSSSANPQSSGVLMIREINRVAELLTYWPPDLQRDALVEYRREPRGQSSVGQVEKRIAITLGNVLRRDWHGSPNVNEALKAHLDAFVQIKDWQTKWKA